MAGKQEIKWQKVCFEKARKFKDNGGKLRENGGKMIEKGGKMSPSVKN